MNVNKFQISLLTLFSVTSAYFQNSFADSSQKTDRITIKMKDGIMICGIFQAPVNSSNFTIVLTHGLGSSKEEWSKFCLELSSAGYGYFIYDIRGHGESIYDITGNIINYKYFFNLGTSNDWLKTLNDIEEIIKHLLKYGVKKDKIILAGASLGANISFYCAGKNKFIPGVILLSPGLNYAGIKIDKSAKEFQKRKILMVTSQQDIYSWQSAVELEKMLKEYSAEIDFIKLKDAKHGVDMLNSKITEKIIKWIDKLDSKGEKNK